jgi:hypothetical protein
MEEKKKQPDQFREDLSRLPLCQAAIAHELLERASVSGKIVLMCQE